MHKFSSPTTAPPTTLGFTASMISNAVMNTESPISQCRCQSNPSPSPILPDDLIVVILSLLNVKSLMKMKCVSKTWNTFITDPKFIKNHLKQSSQNSHSYYTVSYNNPKQKDDYSFISFSINDLLENRSINLPSDPYYRLFDKDCREIVGSCNGLVCLLGYSLIDNGHREMWLRLWNPATRTISDKFGYFRDNNYQFRYLTFGYDSSTDTYKVMALHENGGDMTTEMQVLSFGNNVWRNIQSFPAIFLFGGVHLNCTVNWLAITYKNGNVVSQFVIISLDLGTETHTQLLPPLRSLKMMVRPNAGVCALLDTLCFYHDMERTDFVIWKMTKFGDEKSWTQFLKFSYDNVQIFDSWGINLFENGDTLVLTLHGQDQAILYNRRNHTVGKTRVNKDICWFFINKYVESLVSTC